MVTITRQGQDICIWCTQRTDGVYAEFQDGLLRGFLCRKHFWAAMQIRNAKAQPQQPNAESSSASGK